MNLHPKIADRIAQVYVAKSIKQGKKAANQWALGHLKNVQEDINILAAAITKLDKSKQK